MERRRKGGSQGKGADYDDDSSSTQGFWDLSDDDDNRDLDPRKGRKGDDDDGVSDDLSDR